MAVTRWTPDTFRSLGYGRRFIWIDLVNSEYRDGFGVVTDYLLDDCWRTTFLSVSGLPAVSRSGFPLASFKRLRDHLRAAAEHVARAGELPPRFVRPLNETLVDAVCRSIDRTERGYEVTIKPTRLDWQWVAAQISASFGSFLESHQSRRLKICPNPGCRWVFFDETKGNTKRWCDDRTCGNRDKVRRHRAKKRASLVKG